MIIIYFPISTAKRRRGVLRVSDALRNHPCWRVDGERIFSFFPSFFLFFFFFNYGYTLGTRGFCWTWFFCTSVNRRYQSDILPGYYLVTAVLASTEKLPFSPSSLLF